MKVAERTLEQRSSRARAVTVSDAPPVPARAAADETALWRDVAFVAVPCALMLLGAGIGYAFTLNVPVARERLIGLAIAAALAIASVAALRHVSNAARVLLPVVVVSLLGGVWIIAASGQDVFRGTVGT